MLWVFPDEAIEDALYDSQAIRRLLGRSCMRYAARTDLCGGHRVTGVPTATFQSGCLHLGSKLGLKRSSWSPTCDLYQSRKSPWLRNFSTSDPLNAPLVKRENHRLTVHLNNMLRKRLSTMLRVERKGCNATPFNAGGIILKNASEGSCQRLEVII
jgi:hypothetical protein